VLLRLAYSTVANTFAFVRLLPASDRDKDAEILVLRHQIAVLERLSGVKSLHAPVTCVVGRLKTIGHDDQPCPSVCCT
jgi:hypothetical protein